MVFAYLIYSSRAIQKDDSSSLVELVYKEESRNESEMVQLEKQSFQRGITLMKDHKYDEALDSFRQSLELQEKFSGKYNEDTGKSCFRVGYVHWQRKQYADALDYFRRVYRIQAKLSKKYPSNILQWIERAVIESESGEIESQEYITMLVHSVTHEHRGDQLAKDGNFQKALSAYETALFMELLGQRGVDARLIVDEADLHIKIARMHALQDGYDEALLYFRKAIRILMGSFIRYKAYTNQTYVEIADAVMKKGYDSESAIMYVESLHSSCAHEATGDWHFRLGQYEKALCQYHLSLQVEKTGVCQCDLSIAMLYAKLVHAYGGQRDLPSALVYYFKVRDIYGMTLGFNHRSTIAISKKINEVLRPLTTRYSPERRTLDSLVRKPEGRPFVSSRGDESQASSVSSISMRGY